MIRIKIGAFISDGAGYLLGGRTLHEEEQEDRWKNRPYQFENQHRQMLPISRGFT